MVVWPLRHGSSILEAAPPSFLVIRHIVSPAMRNRRASMKRHLRAMGVCYKEYSTAKSELLVFAMKKKIFCEGSLLDAVQRSNLYSDCKHFVDMSLKHDAGKL
ncbi:hypothetical protein GCK32_021041 [Trichostrongylus colubriformis]|uniref:Uncharacterized protein n=1 Tax=Trichostrongylus colubriformis TaxID=6319 RepID=A0AAN8F2B5_TRICO